MRNRLPLCVVGALLLLGCPKPSSKQEPSPSASTASSVSAVSDPSASASAAASVQIGPPPVCRIESKKVWTSGVNKLAGLTEQELDDGRVLLGFAIGTQPHVLLMTDAANGKVLKAALKPGALLASGLKMGEGSRSILRVTPVHLDGDTAHVFVDFRDEFKDKRRRVACGPADSEDWWVAFDEIPFLDRKDNDKEEVKNQAFKKGASGRGIYHEIRDCRTFADVGRNETWILGSGLHGELETDGTINWTSSFFVDLGSKEHSKHIHEIQLKGEKIKPQDYEVPVSRRLPDGSFIVAVRNAGRLLVGVLNSNKTLRGNFQSYGGFPTLPDLAPDGEDVVLTTSLAKGKGDYGLRALRISQQSPVLPRAYSVIVTDQQAQESETDPDFTRDVNGRRWLAHIEGERGKGNLSIAPIDANFQALGRPYQVTEPEERAASARLMAMKDGGIMVVYIRESGELVTEEVHCTVSK